MNKLLICVFLLLLSSGVKSQTALPSTVKVDSVYNNYLYNSRLAYFKDLPDSRKEIVFVGNSITHWGDWSELLRVKHVINRGIAGDISYGVLARIDEVAARKPRKVFLMIGVNDIGRKIPASFTISAYERILLKLKELSPRTMIYIHSVLPINDELINRQYYTGTNEEIRKLNFEIQKLASKYSVTFINLYPLFESSGQMLAKYTYDGIHLSAEGYLRWTRYLLDNKFL